MKYDLLLDCNKSTWVSRVFDVSKDELFVSELG